MDDRLNREMGGSTGDNAGSPSQDEDRDPGESGQNPEIGAFPGDFPPGMTGLVSRTGVPAQAVTDLGEPDEEDKKTKSGAVDFWRASIVAVSTTLPAVAGTIFRAWQEHHILLLYTKDADGTWRSRYTHEEQLGMYLSDLMVRDAAADPSRPPADRQYNFAALYIEAALPMIQAETDAHREEIAEGLRRTYARKGKALGIPQQKLDQLFA